MKAIIMAGGLGTRLRPLTNEIPKPMVPIIDRPVMSYIIELLKNHGFTDIAVTLNYKPKIITDYFEDGARLGVRLRYYIETTPLGTAGSVKNAADFLDDDFLIMSGDAFTDMDLSDFARYHFMKKAIFTLACKYCDDAKGFGVLESSPKGRVLRFVEKPEISVPGLINTGIYMVKRQVLDLIPDGFCDFGRDILPSLAAAEKLYAYKTDKYWSDIGSLPSYYSTNYFVAKNLPSYYP